MFKYNHNLEDDAAPSRPRNEQNIRNDLSTSSSSDEEEVNIKNKSKKDNFDENESDFYKSDSNFYKSQGETGNNYTQNTNIHISHSSGIQIGHQYFFNMKKTQETPSKASKNEDEDIDSTQPPTTLPPNIEKSFSNRDEALKTDFLAIKYDVGAGWKKVAKKLGLSQTVIKEVYDRYKDKGNSEIFYQLMLKWKECQPRTTTIVGILCEALWMSNETTAATVLSKLHNSQ